MSLKAKLFITQHGVPPRSYTIRESEFGQSIHFLGSDNQEYDCLIDDEGLRQEVIAFLKMNGAKCIFLPNTGSR
jgi:hypothetical protein